MFCTDHWPKASSVTRNALVKQWKKLTGEGTSQPPKKFFELLTSAVKEIGRSHG